tara:strand:- start:623 stop:1078 length:456 start_codon:yes stop_codon:yes gene_type:complete
MLKDIHPEYKEIKATCSCGNVIVVKSTLKEDITLDVCSACHPFYTGKQKLVDTGGRVERFERRFGKKTKGKLQAEPDKKQTDNKESAKEEKIKIQEKKLKQVDSQIEKKTKQNVKTTKEDKKNETIKAQDKTSSSKKEEKTPERKTKKKEG